MPTDREDPDGPTTPGIPSFDSLRGPRRRSPVDLLVRAEQPGEQPEEQPGDQPAGHPAPSRPAEQPAGDAASPRPPEWSDLWLLGRHVAGSLVAVPGRLLRWLAGR